MAFLIACSPPTGDVEVALVIAEGDRLVEQTCLRLSTGSTASRALEEGASALAYEAHGNGITVCSIAGVGCDYPAESCFCQCPPDGPCGYWSYWRMPAGSDRWQRSEQGAAAITLSDGDLEGWVFGDGETPPPSVALADLCR